MKSHELHEQRILDRLEAGKPVSQRRLSRDLGIALGLTNLLVRRLVTKGWVKVIRLRPGRLLYLTTPAGIAAKSRLTRDYVHDSLRFYREMRGRMCGRFDALAAQLPVADPTAGGLVFYGAGEVAEIAYVCLQETGLELMAVVDPGWDGKFLGRAVYRPSQLSGRTLDGLAYARIAVMPMLDREQVTGTLAAQQVPEDAVFWL